MEPWLYDVGLPIMNRRRVDAQLLGNLPLEKLQHQPPPAEMVAHCFQLFRRPRPAREVVGQRQYRGRSFIGLRKPVCHRNFALLHTPALHGVGPDALYQGLHDTALEVGRDRLIQPGKSMKGMKSFILLGGLAIVVCAADQVAVGTWKFNPEKSKLPTAEAEKLKGRIVTLEAVEENGIRLTSVNTITGAKSVSTGQQDGKEYPSEGHPGVTTISTPVDAAHVPALGRPNPTANFSLKAGSRHIFRNGMMAS
jgi:hypothetical protein